MRICLLGVVKCLKKAFDEVSYTVLNLEVVDISSFGRSNATFVIKHKKKTYRFETTLGTLRLGYINSKTEPDFIEALSKEIAEAIVRKIILN